MDVHRQFGLDFKVWDIGRGSAMYLDAAGVQDVVFDLGSDDFSPIDLLASSRYGVSEIDLLCITHPHHDHISDIERLFEHDLAPRMLSRPKETRPPVEEKIAEEDDEQYINDAERYLELDTCYTDPADENPASEDWARGVKVKSHSVTDELLGSERYKQMNNASPIIIVERHGFKVVVTGDNMEKNLAVAMDDDEIWEDIKNADVLVAPHHGRSSSYEYHFVSHVDPDLVVFSDSKDKGHNEGMYGELASGHDVYDECNDQVDENRCVLTTRNDGRIRIQANHDDDYIISYYRQYSDNKVKNRTAYQRSHTA